MHSKILFTIVALAFYNEVVAQSLLATDANTTATASVLSTNTITTTTSSLLGNTTAVTTAVPPPTATVTTAVPPPTVVKTPKKLPCTSLRVKSIQFWDPITDMKMVTPLSATNPFNYNTTKFNLEIIPRCPDYADYVMFNVTGPTVNSTSTLLKYSNKKTKFLFGSRTDKKGKLIVYADTEKGVGKNSKWYRGPGIYTITTAAFKKSANPSVPDQRGRYKKVAFPVVVA